MKGVFWAFLLLGTMMASSAFAQISCKTKINYKKEKVAYEYDLTSLYHSSYTYDYLNILSPMTGNTYTMNICGEASSSCSSGKAAAVCGYNINLGLMNMGLTETQEFAAIEDSEVAPGKGVSVLYSNGDICPGTGKARKSDVQVRCSTEGPYIYTLDEDSDNACDVTFYIYSSTGCGTTTKYSGGGGIGAGGIILIIIVCLIVLYFALGAVYQWKFKEPQTFTDYIIHREFWFAIPGLVMDGVMFIAHGFKKGDYTTI